MPKQVRADNKSAHTAAKSNNSKKQRNKIYLEISRVAAERGWYYEVFKSC